MDMAPTGLQPAMGVQPLDVDRVPARVWATFRPVCACACARGGAAPLGFGPLFALIVSKTDYLGPKSRQLRP